MGRPHVVAFAWPGQGHINPVMRFALKLAMRGIMVTFVHTKHNLNCIMGGNIEYESYFRNHNLDVHLVGVLDGLPDNHPRGMMDLCKAMADPDGVSKYFRELLLRMETPPTCIVADFFVMFTQDVANELHIPRIAIYIQSASSFICHATATKGFRPPPDATDEYLISCIVGTKPFKQADMISFLQSYDPSDFAFKLVTRPFKCLHEPAWIVLNSFKELEGHSIEAIKKERHKIIEMGPLLPPIGVKVGGHQFFLREGTSLWCQEEEECWLWLHNHPPKSVLYISFGSLTRMPRQQWEELATGVEESGQPFLWVLRPDSIEEGERYKFLQGLQERVQGRGLLVSWVPQVDVLAHPSLGAFLTHSGWNSILESIVGGVPMLAWSVGGDQMLNRHCIVEDWGIGLGLYAPLEKHDVEKKVKMIMAKDDSSYDLMMVMRDKLSQLSECAKRHLTLDDEALGFKSLLQELMDM